MSDNNILLDTIIEILGQPKKTNRSKSQYSFDCPSCAEQKGLTEGDGKGNLEVNLSKLKYNCWSCGETLGTRGSIGKLITKYGGKKYKTRIKKLGYEFDELKSKEIKEIITPNLILPEGFIRFKDSNPNIHQHKEALNYLKNRGITTDIIDKHDMGYTITGEYTHRIIIPSYDSNNELNYFTGRSWIKTKLKYKNPATPRENLIFNEKLINWDGTVYIVEGPFDHIVVHNSIPLLGKVLHTKLQTTLSEKLTGDVVILLDSDAWDNSITIFKKLNIGKLRGKVRLIKLVDGYDISKINEEFGREGVIEVMKSSYIPEESSI